MAAAQNDPSRGVLGMVNQSGIQDLDGPVRIAQVPMCIGEWSEGGAFRVVAILTFELFDFAESGHPVIPWRKLLWELAKQ